MKCCLMVALVFGLLVKGNILAATVDNPYETVGWDKIEFLHSMSHQHGGAAELEALYAMGFRHFPLSNYYPSKPFWPMPEDLLQKYPDAIFAPNAEHHDCTDNADHWNTLGGFYATGGRWKAKFDKDAPPPVEYVFERLPMSDPEREPWRGICRTDIRFSGRGAGDPEIKLTMEGALEIDKKTQALVGNGKIEQRRVHARKEIYLRVLSNTVRARLDFDPSKSRVNSFTLAQGVSRPWRDAFRDALDGARKDAEGHPIEGLQYPDGGGITINHPRGRSLDDYLRLLDFDPRVFGVEAWNHSRMFGDNAHFYKTWDGILRTGRRCFGFFVKDHFTCGRGRNVLLVPPMEGLTRDERQHNALRAYRQGHFFGAVSAVALDEKGVAVQPYDYSDFRFTRIALQRDDTGNPLGIKVAIAGGDRKKRPNLQVRFVTDAGVAHVADGEAETFWEFPRNDAGAIGCKYVRVEAFAYPAASDNGALLSAAVFSKMNVHEIAGLNDRRDLVKAKDVCDVPFGAADMIFSQPIMFGCEPISKR